MYMLVENWKMYSRLHDWGYNAYPQSYKRLLISQFSTYIFSADITLRMLKFWRVTKVKVFFLVLVYVFNFNVFEFSEKGLLNILQRWVCISEVLCFYI